MKCDFKKYNKQRRKHKILLLTYLLIYLYLLPRCM